MANRKFDKDRLFVSTKREAAATAAHAALFPIQSLEPEAMVAGTAVLFAVICKRVGLDPEDLHRLGSRLIEPDPFHREANAQLEALRDFAGIHIKGDEGVTIS